MLCKMTHTNLAPVTQCAMKKSLATQVMSHTVAAGIYACRQMYCLIGW